MKIQSKLHLWLLVVLVLGGLLPSVVAAQSDEEPVVRAVLFYSPTCPHCHTVINELIVPMTQEYGDKLEVLGIDTSQPSGGQFYQAAIEHFAIPDERRGVPTLIIGQVVLVGSGEIPAKFPLLVEQHMAAGGMGWPEVPGLIEAIEAAASPENEAEAPPEVENPPATETEAASPVAESTPEEQVAPLPAATFTPVPDVAPQSAQQSVQTIGTENVPQVSAEATSPPPDPVGVALAAAVLIGMLAALLWIIWRLLAGKPALFDVGSGPVAQLTSWAIPFISLFGLGVSIYLAYVEINHIDAVCGPVGHCNIVQSSQYAQLMGIPIAVLGILNYVTLIGLWAIQKYTNGSLASLALLGLAGLTVFSTLFSVYLTVLEIFVINAVCMWCVSSAIISTLLMVLVFIPLTRTKPESKRNTLPEILVH